MTYCTAEHLFTHVSARMSFLFQSPAINKLDKTYLDLLRQKTRLIMERRRQDIADESVDCGQFVGGMGVIWCVRVCGSSWYEGMWHVSHLGMRVCGM